MYKEVQSLPEANFTIVLPGPCNANCGFCFWERSSEEMVLENYIEQLYNILFHLPEKFYMVSISGGEPTLSPYLNPVLDVLAKFRKKITKVVLTTNGHHLHIIDLERFKNGVDFVNISRHRVDETENGRVFGISNTPSARYIMESIETLEGIGIPTRLNCVIPAETDNWNDFVEVLEFVEFAKSVSANSVAFRVDHRNGMEKHELHQYMDGEYRMVHEGGCPVCKSFYYRLKGIDVIWKYSIVEPSLETIQREGGIFELIFQPNGKLTADWDGKMEVAVVGGVLRMDYPERVLTEEELRTALDVINAIADGAKVKRGLIEYKKEILGLITPNERVVTREVPVYRGSGCGASAPRSYGGCGSGGCG